MKLTVLMENSAAGPVACAHGLSLFVEAAGHRILFDAGPDGALLERNAAALGVDLASADLAVLSHGHYDHSGGMEAFLERNERAALCLRRSALEPHGALCPDGSEEDVGVSPALDERFAARLRFTEPLEQLAPGLTLFSDEPGTALLSGSFASFREAGHADDFGHEQNLLLSENGLLVLLAGCAHRGIVNILDRAAEIAGRAPDAVFAGFHPHPPPARGRTSRTRSSAPSASASPRIRTPFITPVTAPGRTPIRFWRSICPDGCIPCPAAERLRSYERPR